MTERDERTKQLGLGKMVARCALLVNEKHPRRNESQDFVAITERPYWADQGPGTTALAGGGVSDSDMSGMRFKNDCRANPLELSILARYTLIRELREELKLKVSFHELQYVGVFPNGLYATALFYIIRQERPELVLPKGPTAEVDSVGWMPLSVLKESPMFADHAVLVERVGDLVEAVRRAKITP